MRLAIGIALGAIATGASGAIRLIGQVTGLAGLAAGTVYYLDATAGAITAAPPANSRAIGIADSTTSIVLSQGTGVLYASATVPGIVSTGTQTMAGAKTWSGAATFSSTVAAAGVASSAGVTSSSATAGVGYATGAGGTQAQGTNKSTAVSLNKTCGQITMHNAALNAGTTVSFTLNNTSIGAADLVVVNIVSGATADSYNVGVQAVAANSCSIYLRNTTAATNLSEAVVLGFAVIKAVAA